MRETILTCVVSLVFLVGGMFIPARCAAQEPLKNRISVRTNVLDWLITVPNAGVEFDIFPGEYNRSSALVGVKYNWNTFHQLSSYYVFNVFDIRGEYRYHFRFTKPKGGAKPKLWRMECDKPGNLLAHYVGAYGDFSLFSIKPGPVGREGFQGGVGVSAGIEMPLYQYKTGAIDVDFGVSAGLMVGGFNYYALNDGQTGYIPQPDRHLLILPMVTELRAALVWRRNSVANRYAREDPELEYVKNAMEDIHSNFKNTNKQAFDDSRTKAESKLYAKSDSAYVADFGKWLKENVDEEKARVKELPVNDKRKKVLNAEIDVLAKKVQQDFDKFMKDKNNAAKKEKAAADKEAKKAQQAADKEAKAAAKDAAKEAKGSAKDTKGEKGEKTAKPKAAKEAKAKADKEAKDKAKAEKEAKAKAEKEAKDKAKAEKNKK